MRAAGMCTHEAQKVVMLLLCLQKLSLRTAGSDGVQPGGRVAQEAGGAHPR